MKKINILVVDDKKKIVKQIEKVINITHNTKKNILIHKAFSKEEA